MIQLYTKNEDFWKFCFAIVAVISDINMNKILLRQILKLHSTKPNKLVSISIWLFPAVFYTHCSWMHSFSLNSSFLVLSLLTHVKSCSSFFLQILSKYWKAIISSPGWISPTPTVCHCRRSVPSLSLSSGPAPRGPHLFCAEGPRLGQNIPGGISQVQSRAGESHPSTCWSILFWCSPGCGWPFGVQVHTIIIFPVYHLVPWKQLIS